MKRKCNLLFALLILGISCNAEDAKEILKTSFVKCMLVKSGTYEMDFKWKPMTSKDTNGWPTVVDFERVKGDTIFPCKIRFTSSKGNWCKWYNGKEFISVTGKDSTYIVTSNKKYAEHNQNYLSGIDFFTPLIDPDKFFSKKIFPDSETDYTYLGRENVNGKDCYKIKIRLKDEAHVKGDFSNINQILVMYINVENYLPIRYDRDVDVVDDKDTMHQYMGYNVTKLDVEKGFKGDYFSVKSLPKYYKKKEYVPWKAPELLKNGTEAPAWKLTSMDDKSYELKDFKGKLVMIDFFYKGCGPCMQALPSLEKLYEKYKDKGFAMIGIDTYDTKESGIEEFLKKRGVTYPVMLGGNDVAKIYNVYAAPTMYFIDKDGKIISTQVGYGEKVDDIIEKVIKDHLE